MVFKQDHSTWMSLIFVSLKHSGPQLPASLSHSNAPAWHGLELLARHEWLLSLSPGPGFCHLWLSLQGCKWKLLWGGLPSVWTCPGPGQQACKCITLRNKYAPLLFLAFTTARLPFLSPSHLFPVHPDLLLYSSLTLRHTQSIFTHLFEGLATLHGRNLAFYQCDSGISKVGHHPLSPFVILPSFLLLLSCLFSDIQCLVINSWDWPPSYPFLYPWKRSI